MSFVSALAAIGSGAAAIGSGLAAGATAAGGALASGAGALGGALASGASAAGGALASGASALGSGISSGIAGLGGTGAVGGGLGASGMSGALSAAAPSMASLGGATGASALGSAGATALEAAIPSSFGALGGVGSSLAGGVAPSIASAIPSSFGALSAATPSVMGSLGAGALKGSLIGAGLGGVKSALTGEDIGKGMLSGGLSGGITGGAFGALGAAAPSMGSDSILGELGTNYNNLSPLKSALLTGTVGSTLDSMISSGMRSPSVMSQPEEESSIVYDPMAITKARRRYAEGGIASLGSYSDGGQLLKGPGDGVSDDIPATIEGGQPARLADGEFVVPARIVSELGNGSTDAGARRLYEMVDRVQSGRKKTTKKGTHAKDTKAYKHLPA